MASTLVIAQKYDVHKELQELFAMLRTELPHRVDNAVTGRDPNELTTVVYKLEHAVGQDAVEAIRTTIDPASLKLGGIAVVKMKQFVRGDKGDEDHSWDALVVHQEASVQDKVRELLGELERLRDPSITMGRIRMGGMGGAFRPPTHP